MPLFRRHLQHLKARFVVRRAPAADLARPLNPHAMTAADLICDLQQLPPDLPALVQGYETGWDELLATRQAEVVVFRNARDWDGGYREATEFRTTGQAALPLPSRRSLAVASQRWANPACRRRQRVPPAACAERDHPHRQITAMDAGR